VYVTLNTIIGVALGWVLDSCNDKVHFTHNMRARDQYTSSTLIGGKGGAGPSLICFTLRSRDQRSMWTQDKSKVYMHSHLASNGSCFMVTWIIFKNHILDVCLTQNRETMALWTLTTIGLFLHYHVWGPTWTGSHWNSIWLRARSHMTSLYTRGSVTTLHDFGGVLGTAFELSLGLSQFHGHNLGSCVKWPYVPGLGRLLSSSS
jgi:hypothetical protein